MASADSSRDLVMNEVNEVVDLSATGYDATGLVRRIVLNYHASFGRSRLTVKGALQKLGGRHTQSAVFTAWNPPHAALRLCDISALGSGTAASPDFTMVCNSFPGPINPECTDGLAVVGNSVEYLLLHLR